MEEERFMEWLFFSSQANIKEEWLFNSVYEVISHYVLVFEFMDHNLLKMF